MAFVLIPVESSKKNCSLGKKITRLAAILLLHYCTATASDLPCFKLHCFPIMCQKDSQRFKLWPADHRDQQFRKLGNHCISAVLGALFLICSSITERIFDCIYKNGRGSSYFYCIAFSGRGRNYSASPLES